MSVRYRYKRLNSRSASYRLIELLSGAFEDDVFAAVEPYDSKRNSAQPFDALSNTWGGTTVSENIFVVSDGSHVRDPDCGHRL